MNIVIGEAGKRSSASYSVELGEKTYSYSGDIEKGVFIEEIVYSALKKNGLISSEFIQVLVQTEDSIYLIHLNDKLDDFNGESTIEYSREEFSDDAISGYISEFLVDEELIVFCEKDGEELSLIKGNSEESVKVNISDLDYSVNISRKAKLFDFLKKSSMPSLYLVILMASPFGMYYLGEEYVTDSLQKKEFQLKVSTSKLERVKTTLERTNKITSGKYQKIENMPDFFEDESKVKEFMVKYGKA